MRRAALCLSVALVLAACGGGGSAGGISREKFVAANVAIRTLGDTATPQQRADALRRHGVTERQLRAWVRLNAREPEVVARAWEEIAFKLDSIASPPLPGAPAPAAGGPQPGVVPAPGGPPPPVRDAERPRRRPAPPAEQPADPRDIRLQ